jgi:NTE family protein
VSGGSITATYYAAFGDAMFSRFEPDFLLADFQTNLVHQAFWPSNLYRMTSPWYGRSHVLAERLEVLYNGKTFGDLRQREHAPRLVISATDLTLGSAFQFTQEQFSLICTDLNKVPLSFAVAASSAVPLLLTPMTLKNHAQACPQHQVKVASESDADNYRARLLATEQRSYLDSDQRAYIHLVDGGLSDNLGVRALLDRTMGRGGLVSASRALPQGTVRKLVLIVVNSERDPAERIERSPEVPDSLQVLDALVFGAGARTTQETLALMEESAQRWAEEVRASAGQTGSPFAEGAEIYVIAVSLRDARERSIAGLVPLLQIPTAFSISRADVHRLEQAGRDALRASPRFQQLKAALHAQTAATPGEGVAAVEQKPVEQKPAE